MEWNAKLKSYCSTFKCGVKNSLSGCYYQKTTWAGAVSRDVRRLSGDQPVSDANYENHITNALRYQFFFESVSMQIRDVPTWRKAKQHLSTFTYYRIFIVVLPPGFSSN
jgi:hypothetical protein